MQLHFYVWQKKPEQTNEPPNPQTPKLSAFTLWFLTRSRTWMSLQWQRALEQTRGHVWLSCCLPPKQLPSGVSRGSGLLGLFPQSLSQVRVDSGRLAGVSLWTLLSWNHSCEDCRWGLYWIINWKMCKKGTNNIGERPGTREFALDWIGFTVHVGGSMCDAEAWPRTVVSDAVCVLLKLITLSYCFVICKTRVIELVWDTWIL